jgi:hypothetical protein
MISADATAGKPNTTPNNAPMSKSIFYGSTIRQHHIESRRQQREVGAFALGQNARHGEGHRAIAVIVEREVATDRNVVQVSGNGFEKQSVHWCHSSVAARTTLAHAFAVPLAIIAKAIARAVRRSAAMRASSRCKSAAAFAWANKTVR